MFQFVVYLDVGPPQRHLHRIHFRSRLFWSSVMTEPPSITELFADLSILEFTKPISLIEEFLLKCQPFRRKALHRIWTVRMRIARTIKSTIQRLPLVRLAIGSGAVASFGFDGRS